jgi:purine catabolism regulator
MAPSTRQVLTQPGLHLTVRAGEDHLDDDLRWVATSEHLDPTPFLDGGELLLTTGLLLPSDPTDVQAYVDRLADAGVVGLGLGIELVHDNVPDTLLRAARRAGLLLLEVERRTPFIAISKAVSDLIAKEQFAETIQASQAQLDLTRAAIREGPAGVVRAVARLLDGWVLVLDREQAVVHCHPASARRRVASLAADIARLGAGGPAAAALVSAGGHISVHTLAASRRTHGFFLVGLPRRPSPADRAVLNVATALLSFAQISSAQHVTGADAQRWRAALIRLVRSVGGLDGELIGDLGGPLFRRALVHVLSVTGTTQTVARLATALEDELAAHCLVSREDRRLTVVLSQERCPAVLDLVKDMRPLHAGLSDPVPPMALRVALDQAERARDLALARDTAVLAHADAMSGALSVADPADAAAYASRRLGPLAEYRARTGIDLLESLRVWLRHHGQFEPAAAELGVHRHTLRDRVRRAEKLLGLSLDDVDARMDVWFALRASAGEEPPTVQAVSDG